MRICQEKGMHEMSKNICFKGLGETQQIKMYGLCLSVYRQRRIRMAIQQFDLSYFMDLF